MKSSTRHTISDTHFMAHVPILWALITEWVRHNVPSCLVWSINNEWVSWTVLVELPSQHISVPFSFGSLHAWLNNRQSLEDCKISLVPSGWVKNKSNCERIYNLCAHRKTHTHTNTHTLIQVHLMMMMMVVVVVNVLRKRLSGNCHLNI